MNAQNPVARGRQLPDLLAAGAGLAFALLTFVSLAMIDPVFSATDQELQTWWTDSGLLRDSVISMTLKLLAAPCFLLFICQVRARLRPVDTTGVWGDFVQATGTIFAAALAIGALPRAIIAQTVRSGDEPLPGPDTLRFATTLTNSIFGMVAIPSVALAVLAISVLIVRTQVFARWLGWLGLAVTVTTFALVAAGIGAFASPLILVWVLATSVLLVRTRGAHASRTEPVHTATELRQPLAGRAS